MSRTVDERVVEMRFDNRQFESNVQTTMSTLEKFKRSLNLTGASKGLEGVGAAAKGVDLSGISSAAHTLTAKFSALEVMGVTALANITNSAVNAGKRIVSALTIDPIKTGFQEYETQINAVQTILANTQSKGTTINDVNGALDELNTYADKTIYNFTEMTRNIGTFTAAGVDLDKSVSSIKGIANLAAVSGSTSQQASTAMYQLSQALAAGKVQLMDWNSVVNAGMGGQVFQDALKRTAKNMGTDVDALIKKYGSFRESLTQGEWLTAEVLTETLSQLAGAYTEADLLAKGYTEEQAKEILELAKTAEDAATKVKTFTQLWDTLKEAAQSGWTQTWEIIVGDFEEAKATLTKVSDTLNEIIGRSAEARNKLLQTWKDAGGRDDLLKGFSNIFKGITNIVTPIKEAFRDIFPEFRAFDLIKITDAFRDLTASFAELTAGNAEKVKSIFKGIFSIFEIGRKILVSVGDAFLNLAGSDGVASLGTFLLDTAVSIADFFTSLNEGFDANGLTGLLDKLASGISNFLGVAVGHFEGFGDVLSWIGGIITDVVGHIWKGIKVAVGWISDTFSAGDIFAALAGGGIFLAAKKVMGFLDSIIDTIKDIFGKSEGVSSIKESICGVLESLHDTLTAFTTGIKTASLVAIAIAIGILASALRTISEIKSEDIGKSLLTISALMMMLSVMLGGVMGIIEMYGSDGIVKTGIALMAFAKAIDILADAMVAMSDLSFQEILKGLVGIGGGLIGLAAGLKIMGKTRVSLKTSVAMLALAQSCKMLGEALTTCAKLSWDEIKRGLTAMGGVLLEFTVAMGILNKFGGWGSVLGSVGILIAVQSLRDMAEGLKSFGSMSWDEIIKGLSGMGGALVEMGVVLGGLGKVAGFSSIFAAGAIWIVAQGLIDITDAFKAFGEMTWDELTKGIAGLGGALIEIELVLGTLSIVAGFSSIFAAGSIWIVTQGLTDITEAFKVFAGLTWDEILKGLSGMGGALVELGVVLTSMGTIAGFSSIFAAGAIWVVIQGLADMAEALKTFGSMTWDEIYNGLVAMGGALLELEVVVASMGMIAGYSSLFGAGSILIVAQGLGDVADALKKIGEMSWDEIYNGLVGMGGALLEVEIVAASMGMISGFAGLLGGGSILLAVQGLGDVADALKKFGEMSWDEIKRGLSAMGGALGEVALGGLLSTLSGLGAISISAIAGSLGDLAEGVKKWKDVIVPEGLGTQLGQLASGVEKFSFAGLGAGAITEACSSIGVLADSVKKWTGVTIPEKFIEKMDKLADGVKKFTWDGLGASALADAAPAIGVLADSVKKWKDVTVPEDMSTKLGDLASGVNAFSFAFVAGWSMNALVGPLGNLADDVRKWEGVTFPEGLSTGLSDLAAGVGAFSFAFMGGWSMSAIVGPLGELAGSVKMWEGVTIPEGLGSSLSSLAEGIKPFGSAGSLESVPGVISGLVSSFKELVDINYQNISSGLDSVSTSLANLGDIPSITASVSLLGTAIITGLLAPIESAGPKLNQAATNLMTEFSKGITSNTTLITNVINMVMTAMHDAVIHKAPMFKVAGDTLITQLAGGISANKQQVSAAIGGAASDGATHAKNYFDGFYAAGKYLVQGFAAGISANTFRAVAKAEAMAEAALEAAKEALGINSPSKEFYDAGDMSGLGFVNALKDYATIAYRSGADMADAARTGLQSAVNRLNNMVASEMNLQPTIRPVVDLSDVSTKASTIGDMLTFGSSSGILASVGAISTAMSRRSQNGTNDDVVYAINKLRKDIGNIGGTTYNVNGITYDDGSSMSQAVKDIVRHAKIERRV